jgi:3-oxoacyl-[acyl-carrier protein] reductase
VEEFRGRCEELLHELRFRLHASRREDHQLDAAVAQLFARQGARVAVHGRDRQARAEVQAGIERAGGRAIGLEADVTKYAGIERARLEIERALGPIDILVANAGGSFTPPGPFEEASEDGWRASIDSNLTATFLTLKSVLPGMKARRGGSIIKISFVAGHRPHPRSPIPYAAAKAGIEILTKDLAAQVGPFGIRANCIAPETILTERNRARIPEEQQRALIDLHPIRRLGTPDDVAQAVLFLASDQSAWISGIVVDVAGGVDGYSFS